MPRRDWTSDSSCDSGGSEKDPLADPPISDLIVPSPVPLSDAEEEASPSLYRKEMASKECGGPSDYEDGDEDDGEEEEREEDAAARSAPEPVKPHRPKIDDMYSYLSIWLANSPQWWKTRENRS